KEKATNRACILTQNAWIVTLFYPVFLGLKRFPLELSKTIQAKRGLSKPNRDPLLGHETLGLCDRVLTEVKNTRG
ncbi:MAG: hypothetical protein RLZZ396_2136, partial [Planctomycetota bacterium]